MIGTAHQGTRLDVHQAKSLPLAFQLGKFLGVVFLFAGFLVSIEVFREIRIPFTSIRLGGPRHEVSDRAIP